MLKRLGKWNDPDISKRPDLVRKIERAKQNEHAVPEKFPFTTHSGDTLYYMLVMKTAHVENPVHMKKIGHVRKTKENEHENSEKPVLVLYSGGFLYPENRRSVLYFMLR